jgi:hypothetical protein
MVDAPLPSLVSLFVLFVVPLPLIAFFAPNVIALVIIILRSVCILFIFILTISSLLLFYFLQSLNSITSSFRLISTYFR